VALAVLKCGFKCPYCIDSYTEEAMKERTNESHGCGSCNSVASAIEVELPMVTWRSNEEQKRESSNVKKTKSNL